MPVLTGRYTQFVDRRAIVLRWAAGSTCYPFTNTLPSPPPEPVPVLVLRELQLTLSPSAATAGLFRSSWAPTPPPTLAARNCGYDKHTEQISKDTAWKRRG